MAATLTQIADLVDGVLESPEPGEHEYDFATHDSRAVSNGALFFCVPGDVVDGHDFAASARGRGAAGLVVQRVLDTDLPQVVVEDVRATMGTISSLVFGDPSASLLTVGVTGTSGKTTIVHLLEAVLGDLGVRTEAVGTLTGERTTPEAPELQAKLADMVARQVDAVAMEVSSHALALGRVAATRFDRAIFTNLGHDHLDFHKTLEEYQAAKALLFGTAYSTVSIINRDDPAGRQIAAESDTDVLTYGLADANELIVSGPCSTFVWKGQPVSLPLAGEHNVMNALAVATTCASLGHNVADIATALSHVTAPAGRFDVLPGSHPFVVAVDYAHKPEALVASLKAARQVAGPAGKVTVVFGCGGDRDREKRPMMGAAAAEGADRVIVTSDNPRSEPPLQIIEDILAGVPTSTQLLVESDRRAAIAAGIEGAKPGDVVLLAGKGHESYQEIGADRIDFDDRLIALSVLDGSQ